MVPRAIFWKTELSQKILRGKYKQEVSKSWRRFWRNWGNSKHSLQKNRDTECRKSEGSQDVLRAIWENLGGSKSCQGANSAALKSKLLFQLKVKVILKEMNGKLSGKVDGNRICLWQFCHREKVNSWISSLTHLDLSGVDDNDNEDDAISKEISAPLWKEEVLNTWQLTLQSILTVCLGCDTHVWGVRGVLRMWGAKLRNYVVHIMKL